MITRTNLHFALSLVALFLIVQASEASPRLIAISSDGAIVAKTDEKTAKLRKPNSESPALTFNQNSNLTSVAISSDGRRVVTGGDSGSAIVWDGNVGGQLLNLDAHSEVRAVAISPDGHHVVTGSRDDSTRLWDATNGSIIWTKLNTSDDKENGVVTLAMSPSGKFIASTGVTSGHVFDAVTGNVISFLFGDAVGFSADELQIMLTMNALGNVWQNATFVTIEGKYLRYTHSPKFDEYYINSIGAALAPNEKFVATGHIFSPIAVLWDPAIRSPSIFKKLTSDGGHVTSLVFSSDSALLVTWSDLPEIIVWDVASGQRIRTLKLQ